jgi:hypothetical protein
LYSHSLLYSVVFPFSVVLHCTPIHLTLLNSQFQFSERPCYEQKTRVTCENAWRGPHRKHLICSHLTTRHWVQQKTQPLYCCVTSPRTREYV